jgi:hypothetical protein
MPKTVSRLASEGVEAPSLRVRHPLNSRRRRTFAKKPTRAFAVFAFPNNHCESVMVNPPGSGMSCAHTGHGYT